MSTEITNIKKVSDFMNGDTVKGKFTEILGKKSSAFITSVLTCLNQSTQLQNSTQESVYQSALMAATLNLPLGLGHAYIVPFNNRRKGVQEAQFQLGYKGLKQLAIRSGQFHRMESKPVYEGQVIEEDSFTGYSFNWGGKVSDKLIGFASYFKLTNGFESYYYLTAEDAKKHAGRYSQTYKNDKTRKFSLWETDFEKMGLKTVSKLHLNSGEAPLSVDMERAIIADQSVINDADTLDVDYVDNQTLSLDEIKKEQEIENLKNHINKSDTLEKLNEVEGVVEQYGLDFEFNEKKEQLK